MNNKLFVLLAAAGTVLSAVASMSTTKAYTSYRFAVDAPMSSALCMQLSEIELFDDAGRKVPGSSFVFNYDSNGYGRQAPSPEGEGPENAIDGDLDTKWLDFRGGLAADSRQRSAVYLEFKFPSPKKLSAYAWYTANDAGDRNPSKWRFLGSDDGVKWDVLDEVSYFGCAGYRKLAVKRELSGALRCKVSVDASAVPDKAAWAEGKLKRALETLLPIAVGKVAGKEAARNVKEAKVVLRKEHLRLCAMETVGECVRTYLRTVLFDRASFKAAPWVADALVDWVWRYDMAGDRGQDGIKKEIGADPAYDAGGVKSASFLEFIRSRYPARFDIAGFYANVCEPGAKSAEDAIAAMTGSSVETLESEWRDCLAGIKRRTPGVVSSDSAKDVLDWVDPFIGSAGTGHTTPAAAYPFGMVQPGPDTGLRGWSHCSSYQYGDSSIQRFSQTHLSGTGCSDFSDVGFMPFEGDVKSALSRNFKDGIVKENEKASPGYYSVELRSGITVETTCSEHVAIYRIKFGKGPARLLYDPSWGHGRVAAIDIKPMKDRRVSGHVSDRRGWPNRDYYFAWELSAEPTSKEVVKLEGKGKIPLTVYSFDNLKEGDVLYLKVSLSRSSEQGALSNIDAQIPGWNFDAVKVSAQAKWRELLSRIKAKGCVEDLKILYTAFYHLCFQPNRLSDAGEAPLYSTFSCWDIYRAAGPLYTILTPEFVPYFVNSMLWHFDNNGYLPVWTLWGRDNQCMIGVHSVPMIADACLKGFKGVDWEKAFGCVKSTLTENRNRYKARYELIDRYGYYPCDIVKDESVSRLLEDCYDQSCAARFAKAMGKTEDADFFGRRSFNWTNVFDGATCFMRGKDSKGGWRANFDPYKVSHIGNCEYTEGNAFHWNWHVMQAPDLLVSMIGGKEKSVERLVSLFNEDSSKGTGAIPDVTGLIGQYCHGNEPSHHVIYFFTLLGRRDLAAKYVTEVCRSQYYVTPDGICGNEDCGQMSAWYIFSSMGFYPFDPCGGKYVLGEPQFAEISVEVPGRKPFRVVADRPGEASGEVKLGAMTLDSVAIGHEDVVRGGTLHFKAR